MVTELKEPESEAMVPRGDVDMLMAEAVRSGNIEVMERVMAIRRELKAEAAKEAFFDALSAFQAECPIIKRKKAVYNREKTYVIYHYAPLDDIVRQVAPLLTKHGLSYNIKARIQEAKGEELPAIVACCYVYHIAGHHEASEFSAPITPNQYITKSQEFGTANSYAKRYAFCNAFGILTSDEDVDGSEGRISPEDARKARQPISQPRSTPSAQRAAQRANGAQAEGDKPILEPAGDGEAIDSGTIKGLTKAMDHATLGMSDFKTRFPALSGLEQVKKADTRVVLSWIASPVDR